MTIKSLYTRKTELTSQIALMAGKKGVGALKAELETLNETLLGYTLRREAMKRNINSQNAKVRDGFQKQRTEKALQDLSHCCIGRGWYDELLFSAKPSEIWNLGQCEYVAKCCPTHPNALPFAAWNQAKATLSAAVHDGVIPEQDADFDRKGRGSATNHDLYSYTSDGTLILVQVRHATVTKYGTNVKVQYFVTDGDDCIEIVKGKANIKKAAQADNSPDSPLRFVRSSLKAEWQTKINESPVKLQAPKAARFEIFKILHNDNGVLRSVYSGEEYTLNKSKVQKAQKEHEGGYYAFLSKDIAEKVFNDGNAFNSAWTEGKSFVVCKGFGFGKPVVYSNGKRSFSRIVITEVLGDI